MLYSLPTLYFSSNRIVWFGACCAIVGVACDAKTTKAENTATVRMKVVIQTVSGLCFSFMFSPS